MKDSLRRNTIKIIVLLLAIIYVAQFGKMVVLRTYIEMGIGNCQEIPILCIIPEREIINPDINKKYIAELVRYEFPPIEIYVPKELTVIQEKSNKVYYKRRPRKQSGPVAYLLHERKDFFVNLFPKMKKQGINNDYDFLSRTMYARLPDVNNLTDVLFTIIKTLFTPNLGDGDNLRIVKFSIGDKKGFITYNLSKSENYFDCNIINTRGDFFKVYIKDIGANLDLDKVLTIISTIKPAKLGTVLKLNRRTVPS